MKNKNRTSVLIAAIALLAIIAACVNQFGYINLDLPTIEIDIRNN